MLHRPLFFFGHLSRPSARAASLAVLALVAACHGGEPAQSAAELAPTPIWRFEGEVKLPNGAAWSYSTLVVPDPADPGKYLGSIDIPRQALSGAALQQIRFQAKERIEFELALPGNPHWIGNYNADGTLACEFSQGDNELPCAMREVLARTQQPPVPRQRPQTPHPPFPYASSDVSFQDASSQRAVTGTLSLPEKDAPYPALLLVGDLAVRDRDGTRAGHKPLLVLADRLTRAGIAVLRADPETDATDTDASASAWASELHAGVAFLKQRPDIQARSIGLLAMGSGARAAAAVAAGQDAHVLVLLAPHEDEGGAWASLPATFASVACPSLVLEGALDPQSKGPAFWRGSFVKTAVSVESLPGLNRYLQSANTGADWELDSIEETLAPAALERVSRWLTATLPAPGEAALSAP
jgi:hypothetical protein